MKTDAHIFVPRGGLQNDLPFQRREGLGQIDHQRWGGDLPGCPAKSRRRRVAVPRDGDVAPPPRQREHFKTYPRSAARGLLGLILAAGGLLAGGCSLLPIQPAQVDPIHYYALSAPEPTRSAPAVPAPRLMIRRVEVPAYLQNRPFVTRLGPNELKFIDEVRWAEPLDLAVERVVRARLAALTGVYGLESREAARDYDVVIRLVHCEGETHGAKGMVRFAAEFDLLKPGTVPEVAAHGSFTAKEAAWDGKDYGALAQMLSGATADLGDAVLAAVPK